MSEVPYLLGLRLHGRRVLVAGGGTVAQRRVPKLLEAGADVILVAPDVTPALDDLAAAGRVCWKPRGYRAGDCAGAWLVQACTDDPAVNSRIAAEAERRGIWCVRADDRHASTAWTPATGTVGSVTVGVTAGGEPRRAAGIRDAITAGLRDGGLDSGPRPQRDRGGAGAVAFVGGGPGDPGLITLRGRELLAQADVVVADRLVPRELLDELGSDVQVIDAAKIPYGRSVTQQKINRLLVAHARAGRFVVRLKGGDPFAFGRGAEEVLHCAGAGIAVEVVPGVTSATAVPAVAGVPVTHRGVTQEFHVVSAHVAPGDHRSTVDWAALGRSRGTLVLLMAVERLEAIARTLAEHGRDPQTPVRIIEDGTLPTQRVLTAPLAEVADRAAAAGIRPPAVVVVGEVVHLAQQVEALQQVRTPRQDP